MSEIKAYKRTLGEIKEAFQYGKFHIIKEVQSDGGLLISRMYYLKDSGMLRVQPTLKKIRLKGLNGFVPREGDLVYTDSEGVPSVMRHIVEETAQGMKIVDLGNPDTPQNEGEGCGAS